MCRMFITREYTEDFMDTPFFKNENGRHRNQAMEVARLVNIEDNNCRFEVPREEYWMHTRPTLSVAVRGKAAGVIL